MIDKKSEDGTLGIVKSLDKVNFEVVEWQGYFKTSKHITSSNALVPNGSYSIFPTTFGFNSLLRSKLV